MTWQAVSIPILRVLINDANSSAYTYTDERLTDILLVAAIYVQQEIEFDDTYTIDIVGKIITPEPANNYFLNFIAMKAACLTDFSTFRTQAMMEGVTARLGPATLTTLNRTKAFKDILSNGPCAFYTGMKTDYICGGGRLCTAIMSPFIGNSFDPEMLNGWAFQTADNSSRGTNSNNSYFS
jgi:hypothetical protein